MAETERENRPHIILNNNGSSQEYRPPGGGGGNTPIVSRDRVAHGRYLREKINALEAPFSQALAQQHDAGIDDGLGLLIEFESFPEVEMAFESLARERSGIELRNVRLVGDRTLATVFVPDGKLTIVEKLITDYLDQSRDGKKGPKNQRLLNTINDIRTATVEALWTDALDELPESDSETIWWEVWLPVRGDREAVLESFRSVASSLDFTLGDGSLQFPERSVIHVHGSLGQMRRSVMALNHIAELRKAKETAEFFDSIEPAEQPQWSEELMSRLRIPDREDDVPHVTVLDTGVNNGHPLLQPFLDSSDMHTVDPAWGLNDSHGHGTEMAGISLFGNLAKMLSDTELVEIDYRLESVKLLPDDGANTHDAFHHGYLTVDAVQQPIVSAPQRQRVYSMAVTSKDNRDRGRPSAWSGAIDRLASDAENQGEVRKLFILAAGNIRDANDWEEYPNSNSTDSIHDPAQAWNALTVGAMTELTAITEPDADDYNPIAKSGGLSPFSTTSQMWQPHWPLKPDVVFEGGNAALDSISAVTMPSLSLLTTNFEPNNRLFTTSNATSAASALGARMSASLMASYPDLWPETIRGLIVHSAQWTPDMLQMFLPASNPKKTDYARLTRHCGFGAPDMQRAQWSASDSLTLINQSTLTPFKKNRGENPKYRDMNFHSLPWPLEELESLGQEEVTMRVTLSYFIEPNPSARGVRSRYRYESHGLRFDVKRPLESEEQFKARLNVAARDEEDGTSSTSSDPDWLLGKNNRHRGSLHSDIWRGPAAQLASRGMIGVYPAMGWWRTRPVLERYDTQARYSLIVTINAPELDIDIYTPVLNQVNVDVEV